jgi:hypothetical protein
MLLGTVILVAGRLGGEAADAIINVARREIFSGEHIMLRQHRDSGLLDGEHADIRQDVAEVVKDPDVWLDKENDQLSGYKPNDLIGTPEEHLLRQLIRAIKHGMPT